MERMTIFTNSDDWHGMTSERIWVKKIDKNKFRIENNLLYAYGISFGDIVSGKRNEGTLEFQEVVERGGHSNYRVLLRNGVSPEEFRRRFSELEMLGCRYESSRDPEDVFAIDVPPDVDVKTVYDALEKGGSEGLWHLDEGNFEHP